MLSKFGVSTHNFFNKTIPFAFVKYEMILVNLALCASLVIIHHFISNVCLWNNLLLNIHIFQVHERDQDSDFCLLVVKKLLRTNSRHVKVCLLLLLAGCLLFVRMNQLIGPLDNGKHFSKISKLTGKDVCFSLACFVNIAQILKSNVL